MEKNEQMRGIPSVDKILHAPALSDYRECDRALALAAARAELDALRRELAAGRTDIPSLETLAAQTRRRIERMNAPHLTRVINATGVVLHTNLGRACLSERAAEHVYEIARGYSNTEYNLASGCRGSRYSHVDALLCELSGAESALVVNNNAAAVLLTLAALAAGGEVIVSRGELVEIGGAFRIPDVMVQSGCSLREVGTTNRTRAADYEAAVGENTAALLKVHTSNYRILGFTESAEIGELAAIAKAHSLPLLYDLGSGCLLDMKRWGIDGEPTVQQALADGADIVCFSGDKLLGGPQAGIIVGKKALIDRMKKHPLNRALRIDKLTLAALESTLLAYRDAETAQREIPALSAVAQSEETIRERAQRLCEALSAAGLSCMLLRTEREIGGGTTPGVSLPSWAVCLPETELAAEEWAQLLRLGDTPIIGRITQDRLALDASTISDGEIPDVAAGCRAVATECKHHG